MDKDFVEESSKKPLLKRIMLLPVIAAGVVLISLMLLTIADVALRFFLKKPIIGTHEIIVSMMICIGFLGLAWVALIDRHIKVDLLVDKFPFKAQKCINYLNYLLVGFVSAVLAVESFNRSLVMRQLGAASERLNIPQYPFYLIVSIGYFLLLLTIVVILFSSITREVQKR
ncbi:MAG TPA: TRAP transporter small permease [Firmicutes bacterium]|jgi:TRAP-type C4-dicarboxylate transport system permease small subunit|nr:TRAP transporter small permease [Bacillota bacterium]